jgi:DNA-binding MarR family transcriptional regulator
MPSSLARLLGITTGGVTTVIDRLEQAGYVRRQPDPADRRRQIVAVTGATADRDQEVFGDLIRRTGELLSAYSDEQLRLIDDFLSRAAQLTANYAESLTGA